MDFDVKNIKEFDDYIMPHIGLTVFKYKAKATALLKEIDQSVTVDHMIILKILSIKNDITQQELADIIYKDKSNLSRMVNSLEDKKCIKHKLSKKNNRIVKLLSITPKGLEIVEKQMQYAYKFHEYAVKGVSEEEFNTVKKVMEKIRSNLENEVVL